MFSADISCLEVDDKVTYQQYATVRLAKTIFTESLLFDIAKKLKGELIRRFTTSNIYKFLELKGEEDLFTDDKVSETLSKMLTDYNDRVR